jgi:hypothetical protein
VSTPLLLAMALLAMAGLGSVAPLRLRFCSLGARADEVSRDRLVRSNTPRESHTMADEPQPARRKVQDLRRGRRRGVPFPCCAEPIH